MNTPACYAIVQIEPGGGQRSAELRSVLRARLADLGVEPECVDLLDPASFDPTQSRQAVAAVYFGSDRRDEPSTACAARFVDKHWPILPVVPTLAEFPRWVPEALQVVNGMEPDLDQAANILLASLGLVRRRRRLFISYLRRESAGVARQLAAVLLERGYEVFLDTTSVEKGVLFQEALWEAMVDTDIVVFLDTAQAMTSRWVAQEYARANELGVTVFHVVWPGQRRDRAAELAEVIYLDDAHFVGDRAAVGHLATLTPEIVGWIAKKLELLRACGWRHRRARLVEGFHRQVRAAHGATATNPACGAISFTPRGRADPIVVLPIHGIPQSFDWQAAADAHPQADTLRLLYQRSGIGARMSGHIAWLDARLPSKSLALEEVETWLQNP